MPGFFHVMKRIVQGKPVFEPGDVTSTGNHPPQASNTTQPVSLIHKGDAKSYPVVFVRHTKTHISGNHMQVHCAIENTWPGDVMLDKIRLLGTTRELDTYLRPHEEKEFTVYDGPRLSRSPGGVAELVYKTTQEGDYFQSLHDITFSYASDKLYSVSELRFHPPVRDIFG